MPKILPNKVIRVHFSLFEAKYNKLFQIAKENNTTASNLVRILIDTFLEDNLTAEEMENLSTPTPSIAPPQTKYKISHEPTQNRYQI